MLWLFVPFHSIWQPCSEGRHTLQPWPRVTAILMRDASWLGSQRHIWKNLITVCAEDFDVWCRWHFKPQIAQMRPPGSPEDHGWILQRPYDPQPTSSSGLSAIPLHICATSSREGNGTPLQYSCLENPMDGEAWWATVHGVAESRTQLRNFTFTFHFHALEKEMATHSSVLAWRIPGTREPGGLPSMGSHRVGHDWSDLAAAAATSSFILLLMDIRRKSIAYYYIYVASIKKWDRWTCLQGRSGEADMENGRVDTDGEGWVSWESGTGTHPAAWKRMAAGKLPRSTGSPARRSVMTRRWGGRLRREGYMCACSGFSSLYSRSLHDTVKQLYRSKSFF